jgi:DNA-directed RNA polymerase specialized sigma24 family protein
VIFLRRYWFSDSYKNIANQMGLSEKAVSVRLTRIRRNLREFLIQKEVLV